MMRYLNLGCGNHFHRDWVNVDACALDSDVVAHNIRTALPFPDEDFDAVYHSHVLEHLPKSEAKLLLQECFRVLRPNGVLRVVVPNLEKIAREYLRLLEEAEAGSEAAAQNYDWILLEMYDQAVRHHSGGDMAKYLSDINLPNEDYVIERFGHEGKTLIKSLKGKQLENFQEITNPEKLDEVALSIGRFRLSGEVHQWMYDRYSLKRLLGETGFRDIRVCDASESRILNFSQYHLDILENGQIRKPDSLFMEATKPNTIADTWLFDNKNTLEKLKIVQISTSDIEGGAARAAYRLHQGLRLVNQDSLVLTRHRKSNDQFVCSLSDLGINETFSEEFSFHEEIQTHYINNNRTNISNTLFSYPYPAIDLTNIEQIKQADVLNLHWVAWFQSAGTIASLLALGKPVVWTLHDMAAFTGGCHYSAGCQGYQNVCSQCPQLKTDKYNLSESILKDKLRKLSDFSNLTIVTPSQWLANCARSSQLFQNYRIEVIPYGIDTNTFRPFPKAVAKNHLNISEDEITLLFGADYSTEKRKGLDLLVQALIICFQHPSLHGMLQEKKIKILNFGHGCPSLDSLESLGIPVVSLGYITSDEELSYIYSAANVLILPSLEDNLPNLMLEAMSCGTPVIAFSIGGMADLIDDEETGRLVPLANVERLSEAILDCFLNPNKYERMGSKARLKIEHDYSLEYQAKRYVNLYFDLLNNNKLSTEMLRSQTSSSYGEKLNLLELPSLQEVAIEAGRIALQEERRLVEELREQVSQIQGGLQQTQLQLQQTQLQLQQTQLQLQQTQTTIIAMESSRFWKIRKSWVRIKKLVGLKSF